MPSNPMMPGGPGQPGQQGQQPLTPDSLASQLFDAAFMQNKMSDPREAAQQVIGFLTEALFYAVTSAKHDVIVFLTESIIFVASSAVRLANGEVDEAARKELLKKIGDTIANAPPMGSANKSAPGPGAPAPVAKPAPGPGAPAAVAKPASKPASKP